MTSQVQIIVAYIDNEFEHFLVDRDAWSVTSQSRCLAIRGEWLTYIPLDVVRSFTVEDIEPTTEESR